MLILERRSAVLRLTLNRPEKRNALHPELIRSLSNALDDTNSDETIHVVVLTGAGPVFCAGLDLTHLATLDGPGRIEYMRSAFALFRKIYELRQPVIAAVNGPAIAGGFDLAAFSDLRFCAEEARFAQTEILLGLTQIVYPIHMTIGLSRAKELALSGSTIDAAEAFRIGLVNRVYSRDQLLAETLQYAESMAERPPQALFETKRLSRDLFEAGTDHAMTRIFDTIAERLRSKEHERALESYIAQLHRRVADD